MIISKKHHLHLPILIGIVCCLLCACDGDSSKLPPTSKDRQLHRVEVATVTQQDVSLSQTVSGNLEAVTRIRLYNEESGRITRLPFHEGDSVKKGTLLVQLDDALLKTDVAKAKASKEQARLDLSRLKKLLPKKISTEEEVARAKTELDLATAEYNRQITRLKRTQISSPINGLITRRLFEPGDMVASQSHILSIIDPTELRIKTSLPERWIPLVQKGQTVSVKIDALGNRAFDAKVVRIHPSINTSTHKGIIEIRLNPVPEGATIGQFARAEITLKATERLVIPVHTVHYEPKGAYVFRIVNIDGKASAEKVTFEQGQQYGDLSEVISGLNADDQIVSRGYLGLRDGKKVVVATSQSKSRQSAKPSTENVVTSE